MRPPTDDPELTVTVLVESMSAGVAFHLTEMVPVLVVGPTSPAQEFMPPVSSPLKVPVMLVTPGAFVVQPLSEPLILMVAGSRPPFTSAGLGWMMPLRMVLQVMVEFDASTVPAAWAVAAKQRAAMGRAISFFIDEPPGSLGWWSDVLRALP